MSISLPSINLSSAVVGTTGSIPLTPAAFYQPGTMSARAKAHVWIINSSGCGLKFTKHSTGETFSVADRHYPVVEVVPDESSLDFVVVYVTAGPPSNILQAVFYPPEEDVSAVAGAGLPSQGGTAPSTIAAFLRNETQPQGSGIIDLGFGVNTNLFRLGNDGSCAWIVWDTLNNRGIGVLSVPGNTPITNPVGAEFVTRIQVDNGIIFAQGSATGVLSRIAFGSFAATAGAANTVTHGLGVIPTSIMITPQGGALSPAATGYQVGNAPTSNTFDIHTNTNLTFYWEAKA